MNSQPSGGSLQALHEANEYLRAIFDNIRDYAVFTLDLDGRIATWNTGAERVFGWTEAEAVGQGGEVIFTPEDRQINAPEQELRTALEKGVAEDIRWHLRKDGSRFFANGTMRQLRDQDGDLRGFIKVTRDATVDLLRQEAENALREQRILAERLKERQKFARDLHDAVSQTLFTAGLMTETLPRVLEQNPAEVPPLLAELNRLIKGAQAEMRTLLFELRPANLEATSLKRLLRQLVDTVQGRKRTEVILNFDGDPELPPEVHVAIYRIAQESLNNIIKHADARSAWVNGRGGVNFVELRIRDNGAGFNIDNPKAGMGIQMMRERAEEVNALVEIHSSVGVGTDIHLIYPRTEPPQL